MDNLMMPRPSVGNDRHNVALQTLHRQKNITNPSLKI